MRTHISGIQQFMVEMTCSVILLNYLLWGLKGNTGRHNRYVPTILMMFFIRGSFQERTEYDKTPEEYEKLQIIDEAGCRIFEFYNKGI